MSASNTLETGLLALLFNNTNLANIGDATGLRGSPTAGSFYFSLHTGDPGEAGTATTSETAYAGYARVAVVRSAVGFTVSGNSVSNAAVVTFPNVSASPGAALTHFGIVTSASGAGDLLFKGTISYQPAIGNAPQFAAGAFSTTAD